MIKIKRTIKICLFAALFVAALFSAETTFAKETDKAPKIKIEVDKGTPALSWKKVKGVKAYNIYRKYNSEKYGLIARTKDVEFDDEEWYAEEGDKVYYYVKCVFKNDKEGPKSNVVNFSVTEDNRIRSDSHYSYVRKKIKEYSYSFGKESNHAVIAGFTNGNELFTAGYQPDTDSSVVTYTHVDKSTGRTCMLGIVYQSSFSPAVQCFITDAQTGEMKLWANGFLQPDLITAEPKLTEDDFVLFLNYDETKEKEMLKFINAEFKKLLIYTSYYVDGIDGLDMGSMGLGGFRFVEPE